jgi:signal transduction histidine kinase
VFARFWRADDARATTSGGLGIGLAVTKEIVERHKGTIRAARREGGGSVFTIRLPLV